MGGKDAGGEEKGGREEGIGGEVEVEGEEGGWASRRDCAGWCSSGVLRGVFFSVLSSLLFASVFF